MLEVAFELAYYSLSKPGLVIFYKVHCEKRVLKLAWDTQMKRLRVVYRRTPLL